jgi:hypothetical protein
MNILINNGYLVIDNALNNEQCELYKKYIDDIFFETPDLDGLEIEGYERKNSWQTYRCFQFIYI